MTKQFLLTLLFAVCVPALAAVEDARKNDNPPEVTDHRNDNGVEPTKRINDNGAELENERPSAAGSEPIFDWKKHEGETEVEHPFADKGLIRIDKDDTYYYRTEEKPSKHTAYSFQFGVFNPTKLQNPDIAGQPGASFADNYGSGTNPAFLIDKEWQVWRGVLGKFGIRAGSGFFTASGHGHFVLDGATDPKYYANKTPLENFTFIALPNDVGIVYRGQVLHRQLFVPYAEAGGTLYAFAELRDDNKGPKFAGAYGAFVSAGLQISLTYFDYMTRVQLAREYGIHAIFLTLEDRQNIGLDTHYDFTSNMANLGFLIEY